MRARSETVRERRPGRVASFGGVLTAVVLAACTARRPVEVPSARVVDTSGGQTSFPDDLPRSKLTVLVFYAHECPCLRAHDGRLRDLARRYRPLGVHFLLVDSEVGATFERDAEAARSRDLPPIALDSGARLAEALGATRATYSVVLDASGRVRYRGGLDSDKNRLSDDAEPYLREALDDLLAGRTPRHDDVKTLGCSLQTH